MKKRDPNEKERERESSKMAQSFLEFEKDSKSGRRGIKIYQTKEGSQKEHSRQSIFFVVVVECERCTVNIPRWRIDGTYYICRKPDVTTDGNEEQELAIW